MTTMATTATPNLEEVLKAHPALAQTLTAALARVGNDPELLAQHITRSLEAAVHTLPALTPSAGEKRDLRQEAAQQALSAYSHDPVTGFSTIWLPAGYPVLFALHDLDDLSRRTLRSPGIYASTLSRFQEMPQLGSERDLSEARVIKIKAVVDAAEMKSLGEQEAVLAKENLELADPRIQALAALLHKHRFRTDLFRGLSVRGCYSGLALRNDNRRGIVAESSFDLGGFDGVAASGSPVGVA